MGAKKPSTSPFLVMPLKEGLPEHKSLSKVFVGWDHPRNHYFVASISLKFFNLEISFGNGFFVPNAFIHMSWELVDAFFKNYYYYYY
jgi:hypothetical protein